MTLEERIDYFTSTTANLLAQLNELVILQEQIQAARTVPRRKPHPKVRVEDEMKQETTFTPRFVVRKGPVEGSWMVWDRNTHRPAYSEEGRIAAGLTEEQARSIRDELAGAAAPPSPAAIPKLSGTSPTVDTDVEVGMSLASPLLGTRYPEIL